MTRTPWVNYALIAANVLIFVIGYRGTPLANMLKIQHLLLYPDEPELFQFFSSIFLHASWLHLIGNMIFLWVFGNALNDRFGHVGYLAFYLAGGVLAGLGYMLLSAHAPVLGASGAISAVTGAYIVLLPRTRVTLIGLFIYIIIPFELSSLYFLMFQFIFNLWMSLSNFAGPAGGGVAYVAHSSGYVFGIAVASGLLAVGLLPRGPYDLLNLIQSWHRRKRYQQMVTKGYDPFSYVSRGGERTSRRVRSKVVEEPSPDSPAARQVELRRNISESLRLHDVPTATQKYLLLVELDGDAVLARQQQLDVANQLMAEERYAAAAAAYERFLKHYANYEHIADIYLMLGLLYGRYLHQYEDSQQNLQIAIDRLHDTKKLELANGELQRIDRLRHS